MTLTFPRHRRLPFLALVALTAVAALGVLPAPLAAANTVGGHFGLVVPVVTWADGDTTTVSDDFKIGFPTGITVKKTGTPWAFDLELVPLIQDHPLHVDLTVHPGILYDLGNTWTTGVRAAFDVDQASWGFTPLIAKGFPQGNDTALFAELDLPVRFQEDAAGKNETAVTLAVHLGWAF